MGEAAEGPVTLDVRHIPEEVRAGEEVEGGGGSLAGTSLEQIEKLVRGAGRYLKPRGYLVLEIGYGQKQDVLHMFGDGWGKVRSHDDLAGIPRAISAQLL
jgi:methylase of polypeptide subunit release factors